MPLSWSSEQILAFAPDTASAKSGKDLSSPRKWVSLGCNEQALWGECQGSGKNPYQTQIELSEPAFKCSCPSRKFPCKHGLGLFLLWEARGGQLDQKEPPEWVSQWLASREAKAARKAEAAASPAEAKPIDAAAQAKRLEKREAKVRDGLEKLERRLNDIVRSGLAETINRPYSWWEEMAATLVDAQAPGLARVVREMAGVTVNRTQNSADSHELLLNQITRLHLAIEGYKRIEQLPPDTQADLRTLIGWTQKEDEVLAQSGIRERRLVVARRVEEEERLRIARTWLWGMESGRPALILQFVHGPTPIDNTLAPATVVDSELAFFPGAAPLRAALKNRFDAPQKPTVAELKTSGTSIEQAAAIYAQMLARNPWIETWPLALSKVLCVPAGENWLLRDDGENAREWPLSPSFAHGWRVLACSGGRPLQMWGEWNGDHFSPIAACVLHDECVQWISL